ncbi:hypothetical protein Stsp02_68830 [Streptomyces sp. NBRC 14336]|nr:hypothetical protein Stsp02_68830 [Streptomyces sp. NBRC 14336]
MGKGVGHTAGSYMANGKHQAPVPETEPGPGGFALFGPFPDYSAAAFAAMSVRCWEPSRPIRPTAR